MLWDRFKKHFRNTHSALSPSHNVVLKMGRLPSIFFNEEAWRGREGEGLAEVLMHHVACAQPSPISFAPRVQQRKRESVRAQATVEFVGQPRSQGLSSSRSMGHEEERPWRRGCLQVDKKFLNSFVQECRLIYSCFDKGCPTEKH